VTVHVRGGVNSSPFTATVNPAPAAASATVDTGFADLDGTLAPDRPAAAATTAEPEGADLDGRVAALLSTKSITDWNAIQAFMAAVVPWPGTPQDPGYVNLHYSTPNTRPNAKEVLLKGMGWPFKTVDDLVGRASWINTVAAKFKDVWYCTSLQSASGVNTKGKPKAVRLAANAVSLKAIWADIDVGPSEPGKKPKYATIEEALRAVLLFAKTVGLPTPSSIVYSGGGIHVYWISKDPLERDQWASYAAGLKSLLLMNAIKCDAGLTTDCARILRVPGTFNHKYDPPKPVTLAPMPLVLYDFEAKLAFLKDFAGVTSPPGGAKPQPEIFAEGADLDSFKRGPVFKINEPDLNAGIEKFDEVLLKAAPIFKECGFYKEALLTGGANYGNELWMYSVLGSTFMENGNAIAHAISKGHATYSKDDTQALYDRKVAERHDRGIGYPSCSAIKGAGCEACAACPLFAKGKSPLNIRPVTATVNPAAAGETPQAEPSFVDPYAEFVGPEFPLDILPPTLANFVDAEHRSMGADPSAIAMAALTAVAGAMHAETQVRAGDGWWEKPIIWASLVGQPSSMKSPVIERATRPLLRIDHERDKHWRQEHTKWEHIPNNKTIPSPPKAARCVINDITPEKVAELLSRDPSGSLMVQDELAGWLGGFERYNTGQSPRAFYLTAWNGGTFLKDRVGKGKNDLDAEVRVENLALCTLGGIQPDRLTKLGDLTSDGLLQRFLTVLMKPATLGDPDHPVAVVEAEYEKLIRLINGLPAQNHHFADEACEVRDDVIKYLHSLETVDGFPSSLLGAIGKLKGYFVRICLVLHVLRTHDPLIGSQRRNPFMVGDAILADAFRHLDPSACLSAGVNVNAEIPRETAEAAKKLVLEFLLPHIIGLYDVVVNGGQERDKLQSIANFILASNKDRLRPSDFTAGLRTLRGETEQKIREWAGRFCGMDWLRPEEDKPGVPAKAWLVPPGLRDHFADQRKQVQAAKAEIHAILKAGGSRRAR
jgi:Protein of unknown function (DUF3987)